MNMTGEAQIGAPRERVYQALNDPEILKRSIPGCEEIERVSDTELSAKVVAKVGPVKAKFAGRVTLSDLNPPESYTISGEGKGGTAGFAKGSATVNLQSNGAGTVMRYEVNVQVGGKLAQLGGRLIDGTAKKLADEFFANFSEIVSDGVSGEAPTPAPTAAADSGQSASVEKSNKEGRANWLIWAAAAAVVAIAIGLMVQG